MAEVTSTRLNYFLLPPSQIEHYFQTAFWNGAVEVLVLSVEPRCFGEVQIGKVQAMLWVQTVNQVLVMFKASLQPHFLCLF